MTPGNAAADALVARHRRSSATDVASEPVTSGLACRLCGDPVYGGDVHPCCVWWIEVAGFARCWACAESKRKGRVTGPLRLPQPVKPPAAAGPIVPPEAKAGAA
jgi:hypothetical protein